MGKKKGMDWDSAPWKRVEVGDDFLVGNDDFGFMGLEVLDGSALGPDLLPAYKGVEGEDGEREDLFLGPNLVGSEGELEGDGDGEGDEGPGAGKKAKKAKKEKKAKKGKKEEGKGEEGDAGGAVSDDVSDVASLQAELARLRAENQRLKGVKVEKGGKRAREEGEGGEKKGEAAASAAPKPDPKPKKPKKAPAAPAPTSPDPPTPLADISAWRPFALHPQIEAALASLGFSRPTPIQAECLPKAIREGRDVIGAAETGSGKTLAFGLPILQTLMHEREMESAERGAGAAGVADSSIPPDSRHLRALILCPTRELALQVAQHMGGVGRACGIRVVAIVGGIAPQKQERFLRYRPEILVATPGRLWELMSGGDKFLLDLARLRFLVLDEADRMTESGHYQEMSAIFDRIPALRIEGKKAGGAVGGGRGGRGWGRAGGKGGRGKEGEAVEEADGEAFAEETGWGRGANVDGTPSSSLVHRPLCPLQTFVFSATLTLPEEMKKRFRGGSGGYGGKSSSLSSLMSRLRWRGAPAVIDVTGERHGVALSVTEACLTCVEEDRDAVLYCLLATHPGKTLVFVNAISAVRRVAAILKLLGLSVQPIHAQQQQRQRLKSLDRFRADPHGILVATDVAARGLDIPEVRTVVHYQIPASADVYVHRSGRTGRAGREGIAIALAAPQEKSRLGALCKSLGRPDPPEFPLDPSLMEPSRERVALAVRLDKLVRTDRKDQADLDWFKRQGELIGLDISSEDDVPELAKRKRAREGNKKGGDRGPSDQEKAEDLKAELAKLLAAPLAPKLGRRFFTGGALGLGGAGGLAAAAAAKAVQDEGGEGEEEAEGSGARAMAAIHAASLPQALQLASRVRDATLAADADVSRKVAAQKKKEAKKKKKGKAGAGGVGGAGGDPRKAALARALQAAKGKKSRKLMVVPSALGRDVSGPDALTVLRAKMEAIRG